MDDNLMWFGNRNYMQWVPCPQVGAQYGLSGSRQSSEYLSGGSFIRNSVNKAKSFSLSWSLKSRDSIRSITDFAEGVYGSGPIYWSDPMTMDKNPLAQSFATPSIGGYDGPILAGTSRPVLSQTPTNTLAYPFEWATYTLAVDDSAMTHWVPIPPGHKAWVGAHGDTASTLRIKVQPTNGNATSGAPAYVSVRSVNDPVRASDSFSPTSSNAGIELSIETPTGGGQVELARNLFTNPSFEAGSASVVVRTNGSLNPKPTTAFGYATSGGQVSFTSDGFVATATSSTTPYIFSAGYEGDLAAGDIVAVRAKVRYTPVAGEVNPTSLNIRPHKRTGNVYYTPDGGSIEVPADGNKHSVAFYYTVATAIPNAEKFDVSVVANGAGPIGYSISMDEVLLEKVPAKNVDGSVPSFFYGGGTSPDPDMTAGWVGTAGQTPSTLSGIPVQGVTAVRGVAIRSQQWAKEGQYSMRLIPGVGSGSSPVAAVILGLPADSTGMVTSYLATPLSTAGYVGGLSGCLRRTSPVISDQRPNEIGEYNHRIRTEATVATSYEFWGDFGGGSDIWFDLMTVVSGNYTGRQFAGSSPQRGNIIYTWTGTPDGSISVATRNDNIGFITLAGVMVQVLPDGVIPEVGGFISGQGHSGCDWATLPSREAYSSAMDLMGVSADLMETEQWR